jgi:hypothetical protein
VRHPGQLRRDRRGAHPAEQAVRIGVGGHRLQLDDFDGDGDVAAEDPEGPLAGCEGGFFEARVERGLNCNLETEVGSMLMTGRRCALLKDGSTDKMSTYSLRVLRLARDPPSHAFQGCHGTVKSACFSIWQDAGGTRSDILKMGPEQRRICQSSEAANTLRISI